MPEKKLVVTEIRKNGNQRLISFDQKFSSIHPGQFLLVYCPNKIDNRIRDIYYAMDLDNGYFSFPESASWDVGDDLVYKGPIGKGFSNLDLFENILCISFSKEIFCLNALIEVLVKRDKNIAFFGNNQPLLLDQSVEIIINDMMNDAIQWADFIVIETSDDDQFLDQKFVEKLKQAGIPVEVMIHNPILCSGDAGCMLCSVKTKKGWIKTCQSGSVFNLNELEIN